ncbi:hypothetical protein [Hyphomicrobium sp. DY-1]|jgi:hypothetical protein|uniref:hypothetical protein n=1 Tax=Hyphomicrobium sp. DY-1 TaxID=3075650 RepID=UPI0039C23F95
MPKTPRTPGTHADGDATQQPRQTETPTKRERSAVANEDHTKARQKLADETRAPERKRRA